MHVLVHVVVHDYAMIMLHKVTLHDRLHIYMALYLTERVVK